MDNKYTHLRILRKTLQPLRMLHALTGESQLDLIDRLVAQELERIQQEKSRKDDRSESV
jgi:hypothetical protein